MTAESRVEFVDRTLTCKTCRQSFTWTRDQQRFHSMMAFRHQPRHCPDCRARRGMYFREQRTSTSPGR